MKEYKTHAKSVRHKRIEKENGSLNVGSFALCRLFGMAQTMTDDNEQVTCLLCQKKLQSGGASPHHLQGDTQ